MDIKAPSKGSVIAGLKQPVDLQPPVLNGEAALDAGHLMRLAEGLAVGFPDRIFGTPKGKESAEWIALQMKKAGLKPAVNGSFLQDFRYPVGNEMWPGHNVVGLLEGSDPKLKDEYIIVSAHHDSQEGTYLGANDNASGCALVLALAQAFAKNPPARSILFVTFDGEEGLRFQGKYQAGRRGSRHYSENPVVPLSKTALMINADMIGQPHLESGPRNQIYQWASKDNFAKRVLERAAAKTVQPGEENVDGYPEQHPQAQMFTTDAEPLYRLGVPIVNFLSGRDLDNHMPSDDMKRLIPSRMHQYARLAHQCVIEASAVKDTLADMGIVPGGLMPSYTLVRAQKGAGLGTPEEEALRLNDLSARLPDFKAATKRLERFIATKAVTTKAGDGWAAIVAREKPTGLLKESVLHEVRELRNAVAEELHGINKNDVARRKKLLPKMEALSGIEEVLKGGIYLEKIGDKGSYYLQQIPERLAELQSGARRLGAGAAVEGVVLKNDITAFTTIVSADRAIGIAKEALHGLGEAIASATFAVIDGKEAAKDERPVNDHDLAALTGALQLAGKELLLEPGQVEREMLVKGMLIAQLSGLGGGTDEKLLDKFAAKNRFTDFVELIDHLALGEAEKGQLEALGRALSGAIEAGAGVGPAAIAYYAALTATVLGPEGKIESAADLRRLGKRDKLDEAFDEAHARMGANQQQVAKLAGKNDPALAKLGAQAELVTAVLQLAKSFHPKDRGLLPEVTLDTLRQQIEAVKTAAAKAPGAESVAGELEFWVRWLGEYIPFEPRAKDQARARKAAHDKSVPLLPQIWKELSADIVGSCGITEDLARSPQKTRVALEILINSAKDRGQSDRAAEAMFRKLDPYWIADASLSHLKDRASFIAVTRLGDAIGHLEDRLFKNDALGKLKTVATELERLHMFEDVQMGRKERGGPMGVLAIRAIQQRGEG